MKKRLFKLFMANLLVVSMVLSFAGCSKKSDPASSDDGKATTDTADKADTADSAAADTADSADAASDEPVTLTYTHFFTQAEVDGGNAAAQVSRDLTAKWLEAHPNVTMEQTELANADYKTKISTLAAADDLPDVFFMQGMEAPNMISQGLVTDLTDAIAGTDWGSKVIQSYLVPFQKDGKTYGIPCQADGTCTVMVYNKQLWKDAGYDTFPETWDEVIKASEYFKSQGIDTVAFGDSENWQLGSCFLSAIGNRFTGEDWTQSIIKNDGSAKFTDPEFIAAAKFTQDLFKSGAISADFATMNDKEATQLYIDGKAASLMAGNWNVDVIHATAEQSLVDNTSVAPYPQPAGATGAEKTHATGIGYSIAINSKLQGAAKEAAIDFALSVAGKEFAETLATGYAKKTCIDVGEVDLSKFDQLTIDMFNYYSNPACTIYDSYMDATVAAVTGTAGMDLLNGVITPEEFAAQHQAAQDALAK